MTDRSLRDLLPIRKVAPGQVDWEAVARNAAQHFELQKGNGEGLRWLNEQAELHREPALLPEPRAGDGTERRQCGECGNTLIEGWRCGYPDCAQKQRGVEHRFELLRELMDAVKPGEAVALRRVDPDTSDKYPYGVQIEVGAECYYGNAELLGDALEDALDSKPRPFSAATPPLAGDGTPERAWSPEHLEDAFVHGQEDGAMTGDQAALFKRYVAVFERHRSPDLFAATPPKESA